MLTLKINTENLCHNARFLSDRVESRLCAVVKANAYGHGLQCTQYLDKYADCFAVACGEEARELRRYTDKPIYVLGPSEDIGDEQIIYSASNEGDLIHKRVSVKVNTGMNRLGLAPRDAERFIKLCASKGVSVDSIYTHFSDLSYAPIQLDSFLSIETNLKRHAAATNFLHLDNKFQLDMVRCGLGFYGYGDENLRPVLSAYTEVYNIIDIKKGDHIGYSFVSDRNMTVAVLGAGYADGIGRSEQVFFIGGKRCKTVGHVCMDMCFADVSGLKVRAGDVAEYVGPNISGEEVAERNDTIVYEILTSFGSRSRRIYE